VTAGSPRTLDDGLRVDRIVSGPLAGLYADAWDTSRCTTDACAGIRRH
jgi:hypothetical protein